MYGAALRLTGGRFRQHWALAASAALWHLYVTVPITRAAAAHIGAARPFAPIRHLTVHIAINATLAVNRAWRAVVGVAGLAFVQGAAGSTAVRRRDGHIAKSHLLPTRAVF